MRHLFCIVFFSIMTLLVGACAESNSAKPITTAVVGYVGKELGPWFVLRTPDGTSTATMDSVMGMQNFAIQAHTDSSLSLKHSINIGFSIVNGDITEVGVKFFPNDSVWPLFADYRRSVTLMSYAVDDFEGDTRIRGQLVGQLFPQESLTATPDLTYPVPLVLNFDTVVTHEN